MELKTITIQMNQEKGRAFHQVTLNDDVNIAETKPDIAKVIRDGGEINVEEVKVTDGHVSVRGYLDFQLLYAIGGNTKGIDTLSGKLPFEENLIVDGCKAGDTARADCRLEDLTISLINSRKLSVNALMDVTAILEEDRDADVATGTDDDAQTLMRRFTCLKRTFSNRDTFRFKEELSLPSNKPNVAKTLLSTIQVRGVETKPLDGKIEVKGEAFLFLLYEGEEEEGRVEYLETSVNFEGDVTCDMSQEGMIADITTKVQHAEYEVRSDFDGEMRSLAVDLVLELGMNLYEEEEQALMEDVYGIGRNLIPQKQTNIFEKFLMKNASRAKVTDKVTLEPPQGGILQICSCEGRVNLEPPEMVQDGILTEGTVNVTLLYITGDDACPVGAAKVNLYFHHTIEVPDINENCRFHVEADLAQLSASMVDNNQAEVKATVQLNVFVLNTQEIQTITDVKEGEVDEKRIENMAGIVGYIIAKGDRLWDIAKENETTVGKIVEVNHLASTEVKEGDRILIVKEINTNS